MGDGLTLKPGRQKDAFMKIIGLHFPKLLPKYERLYGNNNKWGILDIPTAKRMGMENTHDKAKKYALRYGMVAKGWYGDGKW